MYDIGWLTGIEPALSAVLSAAVQELVQSQA